MDQRNKGRYILPSSDSSYGLPGGIKRRPVGITLLAAFNLFLATYVLMFALLPLVLVLLLGASNDTSSGVVVLAFLLIGVLALWVAFSYLIGFGLWRMDPYAYRLTLILSSLVLLADAALYITRTRPPTVVTLLWDVLYLISLGYFSLPSTRSAFR